MGALVATVLPAIGDGGRLRRRRLQTKALGSRGRLQTLLQAAVQGAAWSWRR
jgi:hypothetical protein